MLPFSPWHFLNKAWMTYYDRQIKINVIFALIFSREFVELASMPGFILAFLVRLYFLFFKHPLRKTYAYPILMIRRVHHRSISFSQIRNWSHCKNVNQILTDWVFTFVNGMPTTERQPEVGLSLKFNIWCIFIKLS